MNKALPSALLYLLALAAGVSETLSLAPFHYTVLAIISPAVLYALLQSPSKHKRWLHGALLGLSFGIGLFGSGASWVYVSIHQFGNAAPAFASLLTVLFCLLCCLIPIITWGLFGWLGKHRWAWLSFAACWVLGEQLSSWLLTGFPWLHLGYSHTTSLLGAWAPITGVYGISFILALSGAAAVELLKCLQRQASQRQQALIACALTLILWLAALPLNSTHWTTAASPQATRVAMVQANIAQSEKWLPENIQPTLRLYASMSQSLWEQYDLVIWPEAALPLLYQQAKPYLDGASAQASRYDSQLLTGIPYRDSSTQRIHNSAIALGKAEGVYHKRHLVPFGEYIPLEAIAGRLMAFFSLPMSTMSPGSTEQTPLQFRNANGEHWRSLPLICYEIVYPTLTAYSARHSDILITLGNDSWFGKSIGPLQHLQIAQMRARENGRYVLRSTGTGVTAIINPQGEITHRGPQFKQRVIQGEARAMRGNTPWMQLGYWLFPLFCAAIVAIAAGRRLLKPQ